MAIGADRGGAGELEVGGRRRRDREGWAAVTVPDRSSVPPEAVTVPVPARFAATVPLPLSVAPAPMVSRRAVGERAAVELDLAVGDALGRGDRQAARSCRPPASGWRC